MRIERIIYRNYVRLFAMTPILYNAIAATAALFSPRASVKRKDAHALLRAYVKHMIWYKKGQMY